MPVGEKAEQDELERVALADDGALDLDEDFVTAHSNVSEAQHAQILSSSATISRS